MSTGTRDYRTRRLGARGNLSDEARPWRDNHTVFDVDNLIQDCRLAIGQPEPHRAVREVVERAVSAGDDIAETLKPSTAGFTLLHHDTDLTVLHVVWAPRMSIYPHDHRMWAVIGIYAGQEDNSFFRRTGPAARTITESGGKRLAEGDVAVLGMNTIHAVSNPRDRLTGAIHVYGGDFINQQRSQWGPGPREERPYDVAEAQRHFAEANAAWPASASPN
jgi:predicted metal-dependent enzyme (double-stranded beta helix superfamily)